MRDDWLEMLMRLSVAIVMAATAAIYVMAAAGWAVYVWRVWIR